MNFRTLLKTSTATALLISAGLLIAGSDDAGASVKLSAIADGYSATSVNTTAFRYAPLVTHGDIQYAAFYDPEGYLTLARRNVKTNHWETNRTQYKGNVADAHNVISMGVDGDGYLHVSFDHHGHPLKYATSTAPGSLVLSELKPMIGMNEKDVTYPEFHSFPNGDLLFTYRSGYSGGGNMVMNRYNLTEKKWERVHDVLLDGEGDRNAYWQLCIDNDGVIHISWVWRETWMVETNHDLCYAKSPDGGKTWMKSDGTPYSLPINMESAEIAWNIPQKSELINQTSMTADPQGHPIIATYWRDANDSIPQFRIVEFDGKGWKMEKVGERKTPFSLSGGGTKMIPIARPKIVGDGEKTYYIFRDAERGSKVSLAVRNAYGEPWVISDITDFSVDAWEPSMDEEMWRKHRKLHIYVQTTSQGDGEKTTSTPPQPVYVLEYEP